MTTGSVDQAMAVILAMALVLCGIVITVLVKRLKANSRSIETLLLHRDIAETTIQAMGDVVLRTDRDGGVTFLNAAWRDLTGREPAEKMSAPAWECATVANSHIVRSAYAFVLKGKGERKEVVHRIMTENGSIRTVRHVIRVLHDADGAIAGTIGTLQDMTEMRATHKALQESERLFQTLAVLSPAGIFRADRNGCCTFANDAWAKATNIDRSKALGRPIDDLLPGLSINTIALAFRPRSTPSLHRQEIRIEGVGKTRWIDVLVTPELNERNMVTGYIGVIFDISERKRGETALRHERTRAEAAAVAKSSFVANMSHEIRTPMNGVIGFTELLLDSPLTQLQRRYVQMIAESGNAMIRLLNDILDLSKIEAGKLDIAAEPVGLNALMETCLAIIGPSAEAKDLAVSSILAPDLPCYVEIDGLRLRQILLNLLGNAAKFTERGSITVQAERIAHADGDSLSISVVDTGIGISPERSEAIFQHFEQADGSTARRYGGTGLGLAISEQLARMMNGQLELSSSGEAGSCFTLTLPLVTASPPQADAPPPVASTQLLHMDGDSKARVRILLAEDHDINQALVVAMLSKCGLGCDIANDGSEAVTMVETAADTSEPYHLVLMDMQMPGTDGLEATRQIRSAGHEAESLPIVALTANAFVEDIELCLAAGMQAHLSKPVSQEDLLCAVHKFVPLQQTPHRAPQNDLAAARHGEEKNDPLQDIYLKRRDDALETFATMVRNGDFTSSSLESLAGKLHKLAGTAGSFGEAELGKQAASLEFEIRNGGTAGLGERLTESYTAMQCQIAAA